MRCLISGFDAFGNHDRNPSQEVVELLPENIQIKGGELKVRSLVLPCSQKKMWSKLKSAVDGGKGNEPILLILTGLAADRDRICMERFAVNISDYRIPDNSGQKPQDKPISPNGPAGLTTDLPLVKMEKHLNKNGFLCDISNYAGSYLCNEIYYRALSAWQRPGSGILFVHIPLPKVYSKKHELGLSRKQTLKHFESAMEEIARFSYDWLRFSRR